MDIKLYRMSGLSVPKDESIVNEENKSIILDGSEYHLGDTIKHKITEEWGDYTLDFKINFIKYSDGIVLLLQNKTNRLTELLFPLFNTPFLINMYLDGDNEVSGNPTKLYLLLKYHPTEEYQSFIQKLTEVFRAERIKTVSTSEEAYEIKCEGALLGCIEAFRTGIYHKMSKSYKDIIIKPFKVAATNDKATKAYNTMLAILNNDNDYRRYLETRLNVQLPKKGGLMSRLDKFNYVTKERLIEGNLI